MTPAFELLPADEQTPTRARCSQGGKVRVALSLLALGCACALLLGTVCAIVFRSPQLATDIIHLGIGSQPQHPISSDLFSLFLETEINLGGEGGLYAELVRNRDFEALGRGCVDECPKIFPWKLPPFESIDGRDPHEPAPQFNDFRPWSSIGGAQLQIDDSTAPFASNPHSLRVECASGGGVRNPGYFGMAVQRGSALKLTLYARSIGVQPLRLVARMTVARSILASSSLTDVRSDGSSDGMRPLGDGWAKYEAKLWPTTTVSNATLEVLLADSSVRQHWWLDGVSLFPADSVGGLFRRDLFDKLAALRPGFVRTPGGNYLEGHGPRTRWDWRKTLGHWAARTGHYNVRNAASISKCFHSLLRPEREPFESRLRSRRGDIG